MAIVFFAVLMLLLQIFFCVIRSLLRLHCGYMLVHVLDVYWMRITVVVSVYFFVSCILLCYRSFIVRLSFLFCSYTTIWNVWNIFRPVFLFLHRMHFTRLLFSLYADFWFQLENCFGWSLGHPLVKLVTWSIWCTFSSNFCSFFSRNSRVCLIDVIITLIVHVICIFCWYWSSFSLGTV